MTLPIDSLLPDIVAALREGSRLVLRAPPGAGKTTRVPAALLDAGVAGDKEIVVLEPRRIAARAAADYVARERGAAVGGEVGYRVRFDSRGGARTRLWFVTEGILGRQIARDPFLERIGAVVLDEFHERHLQGDVALGVVCELQETVRPDLRLAVMSATLETDRLASFLGDCRVVTSEGRSHPVRVEYEPGGEREPLPPRVLRAVERLLREEPGGDVLVFLPGAREIQRTAEALAPLAAARDLLVVPLHGDLPLEAQERAIRRATRRKVVLATNVAETALTIEGVTAVIDSGLARLSRFDARRGINALRLVPISRASADQRTGRAGRTAPGRCVRLWSQVSQIERRDAEVPEVRRLDLSAAALELRAWGLARLADFRWLDAPERGAVERAEIHLRRLGALDAQSGALTDVGRRILARGVEPRLGRMLVEAERRGCRGEGALLAALASERDICLEARAFGRRAAHHASGPSDLLLRAELFEEAARRNFSADACRGLDLDPRAVRAVERTRRALAGRARERESGPEQAAGDGPPYRALLQCVLAGFPDRVARRRAAGSPRAVMVGSTGVVLSEDSVVREAELFVAVELDAGERREFGEARVRLASAVEPAWLAEMFPDSLRREVELVFDEERERVVERRRLTFEDLVLEEATTTRVDAAAASEVLRRAAGRAPRRAARLDEEDEVLLRRLAFLSRAMPELDLPTDLEALLGETVASLCWGRTSFAELRSLDLRGALLGQLSHAQRLALEREAPRRFALPSGRSAQVDYDPDRPPTVKARIQEVFGLTATPRLGGGRVPLVFQLLAPNQRPAQITDDLASFWRTTYPEVRRQLRGRYPKHHWPEDPLSATPTSRAKSRGPRD